LTCSRKRPNSRACRRLAEDDRQTDAVVAKTCLAKRPGGMVTQQSAPPSQASPFPRLPVLFVPLLLVAMFAAAALLALSLPLRLPPGSFCWYVAVDPDAFQRMRSGQAPAIDFFAPVGPMGYNLWGWLDQAFPLAQIPHRSRLQRRGGESALAAGGKRYPAMSRNVLKVRSVMAAPHRAVIAWLVTRCAAACCPVAGVAISFPANRSASHCRAWRRPASA